MMPHGGERSVLYLDGERAIEATVYRTCRSTWVGWRSPGDDEVVTLPDEETIDILVHDPHGDYWVYSVPHGPDWGQWIWPWDSWMRRKDRG